MLLPHAGICDLSRSPELKSASATDPAPERFLVDRPRLCLLISGPRVADSEPHWVCLDLVAVEPPSTSPVPGPALCVSGGQAQFDVATTSSLCGLLLPTLR